MRNIVGTYTRVWCAETVGRSRTTPPERAGPSRGWHPSVAGQRSYVRATKEADMAKVTQAKIFTFLWYATGAEEAARFYASIFPDSRVDRVTPLPADSPSGPAGSVELIEFTLCGQSFLAISAGPLDPFNHAISLHVTCEDQAELDRYWNALLEGGAAEQCGWVKDRYGVSWQIAPAGRLHSTAM
jgi:predicted 3-demethylubiquinone-9 3-methyltransferase (glyoxalase superfamily)